MLPSQRHLFEIPREVAYFNNGSYTPLPRQVREAGEAGVAAKSQPWLMDPGAIRDQAEATRAAAASFIGASADDIAIVHSAAYGIATAAANLPIEPGARILMIEGEFPSQALEWARRAELTGAVLDIVRCPADGNWTAALARRIEQRGLPPVCIAALTPLDWTTGRLIDLPALLGPLRRQGAAIVVDATQAAGMLPLDAWRVGADYMVFPTYKWLLGPYTLAFLYAAPERQNGTPLEQHGHNRANGTEPFNGVLGCPVPTARRFDMGQRYNPVSLPMALAGMKLLQSWGQTAIIQRVRTLTKQLAAKAETHGLQAIAPHQRAPHILGLQPPPGHTAAAIVAGLAKRGVYVADRGGVIRVGAHVFNDEQDVKHFAAALRECLTVNS